MACGLAPNDFPFFSLIDLFFDQFLGDFFDAIFWSIDLLDVFSKKNSDRFKILEKSSLLQRTSLQRWLLHQTENLKPRHMDHFGIVRASGIQI